MPDPVGSVTSSDPSNSERRLTCDHCGGPAYNDGGVVRCHVTRLPTPGWMRRALDGAIACVYCGLDASPFDEHEACVERSMCEAVQNPELDN